jgi:hypothetical protein
MDLMRSRFAIRPDIRRFENPDDMFGRCRKCGRPLVFLPEDRRFGFCFDCLDGLQLMRKADAEDGRSFSITHENFLGMR